MRNGMRKLYLIVALAILNTIAMTILIVFNQLEIASVLAVVAIILLCILEWRMKQHAKLSHTLLDQNERELQIIRVKQWIGNTARLILRRPLDETRN